MRRRSRTRRVLKWVGTVVSVLIAIAWTDGGHTGYLISTQYFWETSEHYGYVGITSGFFWTLWGKSPPPSHLRVTDSKWIARGGPTSAVTKQEAWTIAVFAADARWRPEVRVGQTWGKVYVPLWVPLVPAVIATALLWRRDGRVAPGHCQRCGYDLTGNVSGRCPECGTATDAKVV